jgi:hypothetical protein
MSAEKSKSRAAEEMESSMEERDKARLESERREVKNLNQGMDASGHDATHTGINWGPSYKARKKKKTKKGAKD